MKHHETLWYMKERKTNQFTFNEYQLPYKV